MRFLILIVSILFTVNLYAKYSFALSMRNCKLLLTSVNAQPESSDSISTMDGQKLSIMCTKVLETYNCDFTDSSGKELGHILYQAKTNDNQFLELSSSDSTSMITISKISKTATHTHIVSVINHYEVSGSRLCLGYYFDRDDLDKIVVKK